MHHNPSCQKGGAFEASPPFCSAAPAAGRSRSLAGEDAFKEEVFREPRSARMQRRRAATSRRSLHPHYLTEDMPRHFVQGDGESQSRRRRSVPRAVCEQDGICLCLFSSPCVSCGPGRESAKCEWSKEAVCLHCLSSSEGAATELSRGSLSAGDKRRPGRFTEKKRGVFEGKLLPPPAAARTPSTHAESNSSGRASSSLPLPLSPNGSSREGLYAGEGQQAAAAQGKLRPAKQQDGFSSPDRGSRRQEAETSPRLDLPTEARFCVGRARTSGKVFKDRLLSEELERRASELEPRQQIRDALCSGEIPRQSSLCQGRFVADGEALSLEEARKTQARIALAASWKGVWEKSVFFGCDERRASSVCSSSSALSSNTRRLPFRPNSSKRRGVECQPLSRSCLALHCDDPSSSSPTRLSFSPSRTASPSRKTAAGCHASKLYCRKNAALLLRCLRSSATARDGMRRIHPPCLNSHRRRVFRALLKKAFRDAEVLDWNMRYKLQRRQRSWSEFALSESGFSFAQPDDELRQDCAASGDCREWTHASQSSSIALCSLLRNKSRSPKSHSEVFLRRRCQGKDFGCPDTSARRTPRNRGCGAEKGPVGRRPRPPAETAALASLASFEFGEVLRSSPRPLLKTLAKDKWERGAHQLLFADAEGNTQQQQLTASASSRQNSNPLDCCEGDGGGAWKLRRPRRLGSSEAERRHSDCWLEFSLRPRRPSSPALPKSRRQAAEAFCEASSWRLLCSASDVVSAQGLFGGQASSRVRRRSPLATSQLPIGRPSSDASQSACAQSPAHFPFAPALFQHAREGSVQTQETRVPPNSWESTTAEAARLCGSLGLLRLVLNQLSAERAVCCYHVAQSATSEEEAAAAKGELAHCQKATLATLKSLAKFLCRKPQCPDGARRRCGEAGGPSEEKTSERLWRFCQQLRGSTCALQAAARSLLAESLGRGRFPSFDREAPGGLRCSSALRCEMRLRETRRAEIANKLLRLYSAAFNRLSDEVAAVAEALSPLTPWAEAFYRLSVLREQLARECLLVAISGAHKLTSHKQTARDFLQLVGERKYQAALLGRLLKDDARVALRELALAEEALCSEGAAGSSLHWQRAVGTATLVIEDLLLNAREEAASDILRWRRGDAIGAGPSSPATWTFRKALLSA